MTIITKTLDDIKHTPIDLGELTQLQSMSDDNINYDDISPLTGGQIANLRTAYQ